MLSLGKVQPGSTLYIPFESFASSTGAPITITGLATSDIQVYKNGGTTQRASASGYTLLDTDGIDFDGITGIHGFSIDLSDNTTADFWASGADYIVVISTITVDSQTMSFVAARFKIGEEGSILDTTIATLASQTSFTLAAGPAEDDALNGREVVIHDAASAVQKTTAIVLDYTGSTKTVTLNQAGTFTVAAKDNISFMGVVQVQSNVARTSLAQGGNVNSITLDASASATNNIYNGLLVFIVAGTGAGQTRTITGYNGSTKNATVDRVFQTAPTSSSVFVLLAADNPALNASLQVTANVTRVVIRSGTAQAGAATTITLDASASATNNLYSNALITITGGTGLGQTRTIISYVGSTKVATVDKAWVTNPGATSTFDIYASTTPSLFSDQGVAQAGGATSITLASTASATSSIYVGSLVTILAGTGNGGTREITAYNGGTKVATVDSAWDVNPASDSVYAVIPASSSASDTVSQPVPIDGTLLVTLANDVQHGGPPGSSTATFAGKRMVFVNSTSDPTWSVTNSAGGSVSFGGGAVSGSGLTLLGGSLGGHGLYASGSASAGIHADGGTGMEIVSASNGTGLYIQGGSFGGIYLVGGGEDAETLRIEASGDCDAISITAAGVGKHDINLTGSGTISGDLAGTIDGLTAAGLVTLFTTNSTKAYADAIEGSPVKEIVDGVVSAGGGLSPEDFLDALLAGHDTYGSVGWYIRRSAWPISAGS